MSSNHSEAVRIVSTAPTRKFEGTVWRVHWQEAEPTDSDLSLRTTGRYHQGLDLFPENEVWPALYTSLAPEIALWEMVRRSAARNLTYLQNNVLSELAVVLNRMLDLSNPGVVRLTRAQLTDPNPRLCQEIAAAANNFEGLLVPSAALPGSNLVIFTRNLPNPLSIKVVRSTPLPLETLIRYPDR